ncbi:MAG TPA: histidinol dehydrogenase [Dehalococcoidales bacterium]
MDVLKKGSHVLLTPEASTAQVVRDVLADVQKNGMVAVRKYSRQFDNWDPPSFEISPENIHEASNQLSPSVREDISFCQAQVREFAQKQLETMKPLEVETLPGVVLGHKHIPVHSVGCYVPGGRYRALASAYMSIVTARVAGVDNIIACTPPVGGNLCHPATTYTIHTSGADRIFCIGGVQALAMMAYGADEVEPVDMLVGPGNRFIIEAKRQLFGHCGVDLIAGPTEILVIADVSADPALVACDLLGQAEHDPNSGICLITTSSSLGQAVAKEVERQLEMLPTRGVASVSWGNNGIILVAENDDEAIRLSDDYAPEHLELHVANRDYYFSRLKNYGSLFIGEETTVAYGDKCSGPNHILPTGRAARYTGGLWVGKFLKTHTYQYMTPQASRELAAVAERICKLEGMLAHAKTAQVRLERFTKDN